MEHLLKTEHLKKYFPLKGGMFSKNKHFVRAVDDVSLYISKGETLGLVGESGSGKTTIAKIVLGLTTPTESTVYIDNTDVFESSGKKLREVRKKVGAVFQDPAASLNPRNTVYKSLERPLLINGFDKAGAKDRIYETIEKVNLGRELLQRYPYELSGGQQQRVSIARAIMLRPELLVLDEPTSALDVSVQAQSLNELLSLQEAFNLTYLFITHNLSVVRYMSDRICVMYGGRVMEIGSTAQIYENHTHPYTFGLLSSIPPDHPNYRNRQKYLLTGDMPSLIEVSENCRFYTRCRYRQEICRTKVPEMRQLAEGHFSACHFAGEIDLHKGTGTAN